MVYSRSALRISLRICNRDLRPSLYLYMGELITQSWNMMLICLLFYTTIFNITQICFFPILATQFFISLPCSCLKTERGKSQNIRKHPFNMPLSMGGCRRRKLRSCHPEMRKKPSDSCIVKTLRKAPAYYSQSQTFQMTNQLKNF